MKRCINCFRYCEKAKDAKAKGLAPLPSGVGEYCRKPRPNVKTGCISIQHYKEEISRDHPACEYYSHRWQRNIEIWWSWHFVPVVRDWFRRYIRVPIGAKRAAVPLEWQDYFDGMADRVIKNGEPVCPHCGEMPYSDEQCVFCGQRFLPDESRRDKTAPQRERHEGESVVFADGICPECGSSCGNGGCGPLRCQCGWVNEMSDKDKELIDKLFAEEFGEES